MSKTIDKNIPIPSRLESPRDGMVAAMRKMKVGESIECTEKERGNAHSLARYVGIKIITRRMPSGSYRLWRAADPKKTK